MKVLFFVADAASIVAAVNLLFFPSFFFLLFCASFLLPLPTISVLVVPFFCLRRSPYQVPKGVVLALLVVIHGTTIQFRIKLSCFGRSL